MSKLKFLMTILGMEQLWKFRLLRSPSTRMYVISWYIHSFVSSTFVVQGASMLSQFFLGSARDVSQHQRCVHRPDAAGDEERSQKDV